MARITKRQVKAQQKAQQGYQQLYRKVMRKLRIPIMFRLGIMTHMALGECEESLDLMESAGISGETQKAALEMVNIFRTATDSFIKMAYEDKQQNKNFFDDMCNHAYGDAEPYLQEMGSCIVKYLDNLHSPHSTLKARITIAALLIQQEKYVFDRMRKINFARHKVDIWQEFKVYDLAGLQELWEKVQKEYAEIPEAPSAVDIFDVGGFREAHQKFMDFLMDDNFVNDQCKWAAAMNKDYMPELFGKLEEEVNADGSVS